MRPGFPQVFPSYPQLRMENSSPVGRDPGEGSVGGLYAVLRKTRWWGICMDRHSEEKKQSRPFDPSRHRRQTQSRLIVSGLLVMLGVGGGLVWWFYGGTAAVAAVACLLAGAGVFGLLWLILTLLELWVKEEDG